jgi:hypothetical protein
MNNKIDAKRKRRAARTEPYAMLGAGPVTASLWKKTDTRDRFAYRFNLFRMCGCTGRITHRFTPADLPDLARLVQLLAFEISEDGCLDRELRDDLSCLAACLDDVLPSGRARPRRTPPDGVVAEALRRIVDYLVEDEARHFAADPSAQHIYRSVLAVACWLDGRLGEDDGTREVRDLEPIDYFGVCPICAQCDGYVNFEYDDWFVCHRHHFRWPAGEDFLSARKGRSLSQWRAN